MSNTASRAAAVSLAMLPVLDAYYFAEQLDGEPKPDPAEVTEVAWFPVVAPPAR